MIPRVDLDWRNPASIVAIVAVFVIGALLMTDRDVPELLWGLVIFVLGGNINGNGAGQVIRAINGNAATAMAPAVAAVKLTEAVATGTPGGRRALDPPPHTAEVHG